MKEKPLCHGMLWITLQLSDHTIFRRRNNSACIGAVLIKRGCFLNLWKSSSPQLPLFLAGGRWQVAGGRWQVAGFDLALAFRKDDYNRLCVLDRDPTRRSVRYGSG